MEGFQCAISNTMTQCHISSRLAKSTPIRNNPVSKSFNSIGEHEGSRLERDFEESEEFEVVKALNGDKAPGPMVFR